jgi:hypothetical protein
MTLWTEEAMGVNHAEQIDYRNALLNTQQADYDDDYYGEAPDRDDDDGDYQSSRHTSMALSSDHNDADDSHDRPPFERDASNGFVPPEYTPPIRDFDPSTVPQSHTRDYFQSSMSKFPQRERLDPSLGAMKSLRRENEVPLSLMEEASTSTRNDGLYRSGIFPASRPMDPARMEAAADYRNNLRPQVRKARAISSAREAGMLGQRKPIGASSRWGRFKDVLRGNGFIRQLFRMDSTAKVQARRMERKLDAERLDVSSSSSQFSRLNATKFGDGPSIRAMTPQAKWGGVTYRQGPSIAEVDDDDESMD